MTTKKTYYELLKDPRWQKKRLEILNRDEFTCQYCGDNESTLHVHHKYYDNKLKPWEYENKFLITFCETCHKDEEDQLKLSFQVFYNAFRKSPFLAHDLITLSECFEDMSHDLPHINGVVMSSIKHGLLDKKILSDLVDYYFKRLDKNQF